jgi:hypothetical protein
MPTVCNFIKRVLTKQNGDGISIPISLNLTDENAYITGRIVHESHISSQKENNVPCLGTSGKAKAISVTGRGGP